MWYLECHPLNSYLSSKHVFKNVSKNKQYLKMKTSTQVVGTSGSQKSSMVCLQGMTSQGTFRLGQLKPFLSVMTPGSKKIGSRLKAERTLEMGKESISCTCILFYAGNYKELFSSYFKKECRGKVMDRHEQ